MRNMPDPNPSPLKQALQLIAGIPVEAAINKLGAKLTPEEAVYLCGLGPQDIQNIKSMDDRLYKALGEAGDGCGAYN